LRIGAPITAAFPSRTSAAKNREASLMLSAHASAMFTPFTLTASASGLSLAPPHAEHDSELMYDSIHLRTASELVCLYRRRSQGMSPSYAERYSPFIRSRSILIVISSCVPLSTACCALFESAPNGVSRSNP